MKLVVLLAMAGVSVFAQQAIQDTSDPGRGRLAGTVQDERGRPVAGAAVRATPMGAPLGAILPNTVTDAAGRFALAGLLPGRTYVQASKEEDFYPDAHWGLWDPQGAADVLVPAGGEGSGVTLKIAPAGRLEVKAVNASTGESIDAIAVRLERDGAPMQWVERRHVGNWWLVPTAPIRLRVQAAGFEAAWYGGDGSFERSAPLTLSPRQVLAVTVALSPLPK